MWNPAYTNYDQLLSTSPTNTVRSFWAPVRVYEIHPDNIYGDILDRFTPNRPSTFFSSLAVDYTMGEELYINITLA
jgi:hypothetical protein